MNIIKSGRGLHLEPCRIFLTSDQKKQECLLCMETGFLFRISAFTAEGIAFCITAAMCIITGYIDGSCGTFAVLIVGTVVCFAVNVNGFTSAAGICSICCGTFFLIAEAFTGGIICITCICALYINGSFGTERIFVIVAVVRGTFKDLS